MLDYGVVVFLHVAAAAVWIGSMAFFAAVVVPVVRKMEPRSAAPLIRHLGARFRVLGWVALGVLFAAGVLNLHYRSVTWADLASRTFWSGGFGRVLAWKLALVAVVVVATSLHDVLASAPASPSEDQVRRARRRASWLGRFVMGLSLVILFLAVALVRGFLS